MAMREIRWCVRQVSPAFAAKLGDAGSCPFGGLLVSTASAAKLGSTPAGLRSSGRLLESQPPVSTEFSAILPADILAPVGEDLLCVTTRP
jgi:hypothetical protein